MMYEAIGQKDQESHLLEWIQQSSGGQNPFAHLPKENLNGLYALAYSLYQNQEYQEASHFFRLLLLASPVEAKYWKGLGACLKMQQDYEQAINCYLCTDQLDQNQRDPYVYVHLADCYFALKQTKEGLTALEAAHSLGNKKQDGRILEHVKLMRELWSK